MTVLSQQAESLYNRLKSYAESEVRDGWFSVYLDNAKPDDMSGSQFAGYLSALQQAGLYKQIDGCFGMVKV